MVLLSVKSTDTLLKEALEHLTEVIFFYDKRDRFCGASITGGKLGETEFREICNNFKTQVRITKV